LNVERDGKNGGYYSRRMQGKYIVFTFQQMHLFKDLCIYIRF